MTSISATMKLLGRRVIVICTVLIICTGYAPVAVASPDDEENLKKLIENIYNVRNTAFASGDLSPLQKYFDTTKNSGKWSFEHEVKRVKYLTEWAQKRGIKFTKVSSEVRLKKINRWENRISIFLEETYKFDYVYEIDKNSPTNSFGVGIRHTIKFMDVNNKRLIQSDWYTDCFEDALQNFSGDLNIRPQNNEPFDIQDTFGPSWPPVYNRKNAVKYADKYCGAAWGSTNNFKYNPKYSDFNGIGGDCTNFASQVLGDSNGGGMPHNGGWRCIYSKYGTASPSKAWVNADGLKNYLIYSGRGRIIKRGTYEEILKSYNGDYRNKSIELLPGDLICYEKKGDIDHFAVVTAFDSKGYPLVNSHTTDRYHVPWDLGWGDKHIKFYFIHITCN